ncbi:uncharacterized protein PV09_07473 [Verruconis gallopava]|uniref:DUF7703 domain-containing protein n=1 Tax=Verruconis gallopava TaxID=253628 RepID=A0A0D1YJ92_9PEZI|nr:uncharacterized protein PV09_07473 [Verruconis gallopava]KIW00947.1 hypothetical protein PV09_07473 [Verruconis gallopava]
MNSTDQAEPEGGLPPGPLELSALAFTAMGTLCCVQMFVLIGITFQRRSGLYFWSLVGATFAQLLVCVSVLIQTWILGEQLNGIPLALSTLGFLFFPLFGYLILYSRLHLLQCSQYILSVASAIIALEWLLAELPMAILGVINTEYPEARKLALAYKISWEFEEAVYPVVDLVLCSCYFVQVKRLWGDSGKKTRSLLWKVVLVVTISLLLDLSWVVLQNTTDPNWSGALECFLMALKLHIEIYILNMLTNIAKAQMADMQSKFSLSLEFCTSHPLVQAKS